MSKYLVLRGHIEAAQIFNKLINDKKDTNYLVIKA